MQAAVFKAMTISLCSPFPIQCSRMARCCSRWMRAASVVRIGARNLEKTIRLANDTEYGLVAYLFAKDYATITKVSDALEAGTVCVNNGGVNTNYAPYEGWKNSGFGVELGRRGIGAAWHSRVRQNQARQSAVLICDYQFDAHTKIRWNVGANSMFALARTSNWTSISRGRDVAVALNLDS
jgi:delta 1-pyrroline-5-carboxylate dehydrogenase